MKPFVKKEVLEGLQLLFSLRLQGSPPADAIEATARGWLIALEPRTAGFEEQLDAGRIAKAFQLLAAQAVRWPPPAAMLELLPERPKPKLLNFDKQLTREEKEVGQKNLNTLKQLINQVLNKH